MREPKIYKSEAQMCRDALQLQDGCNLSGIAVTLWDMTCTLNRQGKGGAAVRRHPAVWMTVAKLADMVGIGASSFDLWNEKEDEAKAIIAAAGMEVPA